MGQVLLLFVVALVVAAVVFGVIMLITGADGGLEPAEPDGVAVGLPGSRPLVEQDLAAARFDVVVRGYRMAQVDRAMRRAAYDVGYKDELVAVLEAEVEALRAGRAVEADALRRARIAAQGGPATSVEARSDRHTQPDDDAAASPASLIEPDHDRALGAGGAPETGTQPDLDTGPDAGTMPPVPAGRRMSGRTDLAGPSDHGSWADGSWAERPDTWTDGTGGWAGR